MNALLADAVFESHSLQGCIVDRNVLNIGGADVF